MQRGTFNVQLNEIEELKQTLADESLGEVEAFKARQELCRSLESLLLMDLDYALDKKVEQDLWSYVFRNPIAACQSKAKEQKKSNNLHSTSHLTALLESASGFYLQLLQKLCCAYDIDLTCHPKDSIYGLTNEWPSQHQVVHRPHHSSLYYICQHCLVHLGDVARYRGQSLQAENFYRHAVDLVPSNGQPYNQLALLEAASGEKLSTVFFYMRSLSVQHPFPLAATNLHNLFLKTPLNGICLEGKEKLSLFEFNTMFLSFHSILHLQTDFGKAVSIVRNLISALPALIIAEKCETWQLVQMVAVCLFSVEAISSAEKENLKLHHAPKNGRLTFDVKRATSLIIELIDGMLYAFLLPLHASPAPRETAMYYTLPAVKIILDWLLQNPRLWLQSTLFKEPKIWHALCKLMNDLEIVSQELVIANKFEGVPLPEDWDLQCFLPLKESQRNLRFQLNVKAPSDEECICLRSVRLCNAGIALSSEGNAGLNLLSTFQKNGKRVFKPVFQTEAISKQVLREIQDLTVIPDSLACIPSICDASVKILEAQSGTDVPSHFLWSKNNQSDGILQQEVRFKLDETQHRKELLDDERESNKRNKDMQLFALQERRMGKNVAMQAILQQRAALSARSPDFGTETGNMHQDIILCEKASLPNRSEYQLCSSPEGKYVPAQPLQEVNMNQAPLCHLPTEHYTTFPTQKPSVNLGNEEVEAWIQRLKLQQNEVPAPVACGSPMGNFMPNAVQRVIRPNTPDFVYQGQNQKLPFQQSHLIKKSLPSQPILVTDSPEKMWNYMNIIAYQQPCSGNPLPPNHQMPMPAGACHQTNQLQPHSNAYFLMNQSKVPPPDTGMQHNVVHSFTKPCDINMMPSQSIFQERNGPPAGLTSNLWKEDHGYVRDAVPNEFPQNQLLSRAVGHSVHSCQPPHVHDRGSNCGQLDIGPNTYSLFNSPWPSGLSVPISNKERVHQENIDSIALQPNIQSLWTTPGLSPLERLLEQQKQRRDNAAP